MKASVVGLTEQEIINLRQLTGQPGWDVLIKLLNGETFRAQFEAMDCTSLKMEERAMALTKAQATRDVVTNLIEVLRGYLQPINQETMLDPNDPLNFSIFEGRSN